MSSGGGEAGSGGYSGVGFGGDGGQGLNPNRVIGFRSAGTRRFETPSLNDMMAKK